MKSILLSNLTKSPEKFWPMHLVEGETEIGFRVGGNPPVGVKPKHASDLTQYFGTFPITTTTDFELSVFTAFDYLSWKSPDSPTVNANIPLGSDSRVLQCVFHEPARRAKSSAMRSEIQGYTVKIDKPITTDLRSDPNRGVPHMIGGIPYYYPKYAGVAGEILNSGYFHLLNWNSPTGKWDCGVKGNWPFPNLRFDLYLKVNGSDLDYQVLLT
jgi:hypothetical protein